MCTGVCTGWCVQVSALLCVAVWLQLVCCGIQGGCTVCVYRVAALVVCYRRWLALVGVSGGFHGCCVQVAALVVCRVVARVVCRVGCTGWAVQGGCTGCA